MLSLDLPRSVEDRITRLAETTGRTRAEIVSEAVLAQLDDLEDTVLAEHALAEISAGRQGTIPLAEAERRLGLAD